MKQSKRSKKAVSFLFTTMAQAVSAVMQCVNNLDSAKE
jgi:hypothetical protein